MTLPGRHHARVADETLKPGSIVLRFVDVTSELRCFCDSVNQEVLEKDVVARLRTLANELDMIRASTSAGTPISWSIPRKQPLRTRPSRGAHQPKRADHATYNLLGEISFVWEIATWHPDPSHKKRSHPFDYFELRNASTQISIKRVRGKRERIASIWRFDVGDNQSPGVHFHTQNGSSGAKVDVPRLPTMLFSPVDAIEFTLGELYQDRWGTRAMDSTLARWRPYQRKRFERVMQWQLNAANDSRGSPWIGLKVAKPRPSLLIE